LQAGLWPKLTEPDSSHRGIYVRFSDQEPMATLRQALAEQLEVPMDWLGSPFSQVLTQALEAAGKPLVLLLDQFEQFFVHNPRKEDRAAFVQALTTWYQDSSLNSVKLLVSIRADLLHELYELHAALQYTLGPQDLFKLDRFTPGEATKILAVIAETEHLDFDPRFVTELAERELAHRESGTISPVDLQILAWMIERQKGDDLRAFNRTAFQKFGGVEGLLTRFLERTLDARVLPNQRQAAIKTLLALTDLDRQVRAGVLTVAELQTKLQGTAKPDEIQEAVTWLARSDVRLITPQDKSGSLGYELAHERLIPALMRLAGKELTAADQANQLLERRVNEWLGNQRNSRYLLGWRELWLIQQQRPYLVWGAKRQQKEKLIRLSQRRTYGIASIVGIVVLVIGIAYTWLNFTTPGQMQQVRWALSRGIERASDYTTADIANALIKDGQHDRGVNLIRNEIESRGSRAAALKEVAETAVRLHNSGLLQMALTVTDTIDHPSYKSDALRDIASAYGQLQEGERAQAVLEKALAATDTIDAPYAKFNALRAIASAAGQLQEGERAQALLENALAATDTIDAPDSKSNALSAIASAAGQLQEGERAQALLENALAATDTIDAPDSKSSALRAIASAYGQLQEGERAQALLEKALAATDTIDAPDSKSSALSAIASAAGQLEEGERAQALLENALAATDTIDAPYAKSYALSDIASTYGQLQEGERAQALLENALAATDTIDAPDSKSNALSAIASAAGQLQEGERAQAVLEKALAATDTIDAPDSKSSALRDIASAYGQLQEGERAQALLEKALAATDTIDAPDSKSSALRAIASAAGQLQEGERAQALLEKALAATDTIDAPYSKSNALRAIASAAGQLQEGERAQALLEKALAATDTIDDPDAKSNALRDIASAAGQLQEGERAQALLEKALAATDTIDDPDAKSSALHTIASTAGQLQDADVAQEVMVQVRHLAERANAFSSLNQIASYEALHGKWKAALDTPYSGYVLEEILTHYAESKTPQLIDGPVVLGVKALTEASGEYKLSVTVQSPDEDCDRHANWWEVLSEEGELLGRNVLDTPHEFEQPFTTEKSLPLDPEQVVIVRAHFSDDIDDIPNNDTDDKYTTQAMRGQVGKPDSFKSIRLPARFAIRVEAEGEQPQNCQEP
jgi:hemoglobin-like flavoprotein